MLKKRCIALAIACLLCVTLPLVSLAQGMGAVRFGPFDAEDLNGRENVTEAVFKEATVTLVNFWATWCGPCIQELPDLAKLSDMTDGQVQVVSVLLDGLDYFGERDEGAIDAMRLLVEDAGAAYPVLLPDTFLTTLGSMISSIPTTFIIDRDGVRQDMVVGAMSADQWLARAQEVVDNAYDEDITLLAD